MKKRRILTIDDLVDFCSNYGIQRFDSNETGYQLGISVTDDSSELKVFSNDELDTENLLFCKVTLMHTGRNRNGSFVTEEAAEKCLSTIPYKPVLAAFTDVNGETDFTYHDFEVVDDEIVYYEKQIGCFTIDPPYIEQSEEHEDRKYIYAYCAIPRNYTAAADIIERKEGTKVSVELGINKMSYDAEEKALRFDDVFVMGVTCLGVDPYTGKEVKEGMEGARLDIQDFSVEKNLGYTQGFDKEVKNLIFSNGKEDSETMKDDVNQEVFNSDTDNTADDVTNVGDFADTDDVTAAGDVTSVDDVADADDVTNVDTVTDGEDVTVDDETDANDETNAEDDTVEPETGGEENADGRKIEFSMKGDGVTREFALSLSEKIGAICQLVNATYTDDWYGVDVYDEQSVVFMHSFWDEKHYKQKFEVNDGVYSLVGDRVEVFARYLTKEEAEEADNAIYNFESVSEELKRYKEEPEKMQILGSADYSNISDTEEFKEFMKVDNHFAMSIQEVKDTADKMLLSYAKKNPLTFSADEKKKEDIPFFSFSRFENNDFLDGLKSKRTF